MSESRRPPDTAPKGGPSGGRIQVLEEVGRGATGRVLKGFDTKLRREMAIKVTHAPKNEIPRELLARFVEEAQVTAQLEHPNIVPIHDLGVDAEGRVFFSMKLVRGESLGAILDRRQAGDAETLAKFGRRRLLDIFLQVCQAIEYAHARGVIHRDLKPANVMVGDFGEVAVADWGVAKLKEWTEPPSGGAVTTRAEEMASYPEFEPEPATTPAMPGVTSVRAATKAWETQTGTVIGTPQYMSPEQAGGSPIDERSDLYSLGVMLYEILCGRVPFDHDDPEVVLKRVLFEPPRRPSEIDRTVPPSLEALALRLLAKEPERRAPSLPEIRTHVRNHLEGVARAYRPEPLWKSAVSSGAALLLFAFLVWYLTGQSVATVLALGPPAVLNAVGWFLLVLAVGYPLWAAAVAFRVARREPDPFRPPDAEETFVSGYLAHRSFAAALAPLFQLVFIVELVTFAFLRPRFGGEGPAPLLEQVAAQMRAEWAEALIVILVFQFAYLTSLAAEVRFARRIDRFDLLVERPRWESVWPFFLVVVLLLSVATTTVLEGTLGKPDGDLPALLRREFLAVPAEPFEILKTLVFQGTFLLALVTTTLLAAFPFAEIVAGLRALSIAADEAAAAERAQYFLRSLAAFRVARAVWLYGGAMIGCLTAMQMLSAGEARPLLEKLALMLGPSLIGFAGYAIVKRYVRRYLAQAPAVRRLLERRVPRARAEGRAAKLKALEQVPWSRRLAQLSAPVVCVIVYLLWTGSGFKQSALRELVPVTTKDWLVLLPYALLLLMLAVRDPLEHYWLRRGERG